MATIAKLGDPSLHFFLTRSVARALGANLGEALSTGRLTAAEYSELVTRCRKCQNVEACQIWLAGQDPSGGAPAHCMNKRVLETLT